MSFVYFRAFVHAYTLIHLFAAGLFAGLRELPPRDPQPKRERKATAPKDRSFVNKTVSIRPFSQFGIWIGNNLPIRIVDSAIQTTSLCPTGTLEERFVAKLSFLNFSHRKDKD